METETASSMDDGISAKSQWIPILGPTWWKENQLSQMNLSDFYVHVRVHEKSLILLQLKYLLSKLSGISKTAST